MTTISLRNYTREVEILIDQGASDEAVKHCKHILKSFPKHVDIYRLLGKAYLENKKYGEASDIFQRVLAVIPDDFVSQIGMSIIREDEGNLDAAIWHIERAFEIQPSNAAIQDEIRRLYGRRDGVHLSKIRLTRGALIRMYMQGELYTQAISEARAALADDPQRLDLEVLLAKLYYLSGQKVESAETCTKILSKYPYCLEVNKILSVLLASLNRTEEAQIFQQRIHSIQPYAAHISKNTPTISQVPDNAVTLEKLDTDLASDLTERQPDWAQTIGVEMDTQAEDTLPDWLPSLARERLLSEEGQDDFPELEKTPSPDMDAGSRANETKTPDIPEWMKSAGWETKQDETREEEHLAIGSEEQTLEEAELPDWLKGLSPDDEEPQPIAATSEAAPDVFEDLDISLEELSEDSKAELNEDLPEWLQDFSPETKVDTPAEVDGEILPVEEHPVEEDEPGQIEEDPSPDMPLTGDHDDLMGEEDDIAEWLKTLQNASNDEEPAAAVVPEWLNQQDLETADEAKQETTSTSELPEPGKIEEDESQLDDSMDWLNAMIENRESSQESPTLPSDSRLDLPAEWIKEYVETEEEGAEGTEETTVPDTSEGAVEIEEAAQETNADETTIQKENEVAGQSAEEIDDAFAWLESLAAKQGADEETLSSQPSDRDDTPPDWLNTFTTEIEETPDELAEQTADEEKVMQVDERQAATQPEPTSIHEPESEPEESFESEIDESEAIVSEVVETVVAETELTKTDTVETEAAESDLVEIGTPEPVAVQAQSEPDDRADELPDEHFEIDNLFSGLTQENIHDTLPLINEYVKNGRELDAVIGKLENALIDYPLEPALFQLLGDAYAKNNQLQEALESYSKAEELLF